MKTSHENIKLIEDWLIENNLEVSLDDDFVRRVYKEVLEHLYLIRLKESIPRRRNEYGKQYDFVRRDLLKIKYKRNNYSAKGIQAGFVYAIINPAWPEHVKVGSAIDVYDRLNSYQTSSPFRDYTTLDYFYSNNRIEDEKKIHSMFVRNSEWCHVSTELIKKVFKDAKLENSIEVLEDVLYAVKRANAEEEAKKKEMEKQAKIAKLESKVKYKKRRKVSVRESSR